MIIAVRAPGFGHRRLNNLHDIAALTGAEVIAKDSGMKLENTKLERLGRARKVIVTEEETANPVIVLKKSAQTITRTWGESLIGYAGLSFGGVFTDILQLEI